MTAFSVAPALGPGSRLGQYEIVAPLRAGGMATLFLGRRVGPAGFARHVAIKVVHAHLANDPSFVEMFLDEARLAARIQHPNVVHTEELGEENGMYYLAMEYVHGCSLAQFLMRLIQQKRGLAPEVAVHIAMKLADGLHAAHEVRDESGRALGVVHRDVSPQNVLLAYNGQIKLIDFGVAKAEGHSRETTGSSLKGKIRYMSPEQAWGRTVDRRSDVYALGIVLWESLTHRRLFVADNDFAALESVRSPQVDAPSVHAPWLGDSLDHAVLTALAADSGARFQTAQAFRRALGGACPKALVVEPDDLGALFVSVMEDEIERARRSAPPAVTRALDYRPPEPARRTDAMAAFTLEMPQFVLQDDAATAAEVPPAGAWVPSAAQDPRIEDSRVRPSQPALTSPVAVMYSGPPPTVPSAGAFQSAPPGAFQSAPPGAFQSAPPGAFQSASHPSFQSASYAALPSRGFGARSAMVFVGLSMLALLAGLGVWLTGAFRSAGGTEAVAAAPTPTPTPPEAPVPPSAPAVEDPSAPGAAVDEPAPLPRRRGVTRPSSRVRGEAPAPEGGATAPVVEAAPAHPHLPSTIARPQLAPVTPAPIAPTTVTPAPHVEPEAVAPHHAPGPYLQEPTF